MLCWVRYLFAAPLISEEILTRFELADVKRDLSGMSSEQLWGFAQECFTEKKIFFYAGGIDGAPLVEKKYYDFVWGFPLVLLQASGSVREGFIFDEEMLFLVREHEGSCRIANDAWLGMTLDELKQAGFQQPVQMGKVVEADEEWLTYPRPWASTSDGTVTFYFRDGRLTRWEIAP